MAVKLRTLAHVYAEQHVDDAIEAALTGYHDKGWDEGWDAGVEAAANRQDCQQILGGNASGEQIRLLKKG